MPSITNIMINDTGLPWVLSRGPNADPAFNTPEILDAIEKHKECVSSQPGFINTTRTQTDTEIVVKNNFDTIQNARKAFRAMKDDPRVLTFKEVAKAKYAELGLTPYPFAVVIAE